MAFIMDPLGGKSSSDEEERLKQYLRQRLEDGRRKPVVHIPLPEEQLEFKWFEQRDSGDETQHDGERG